MRSRCANFLGLTFLLFLKPLGGQDARPLCLRSGPTDGGQTLVTFLTEDLGSLYLSVWSRDRLVTCEVTSDPQVTQSYWSFCDGSSDGEESQLPVRRLLAADSPCSSAAGARSAAAGPHLQGRPRRKRAFTFPGTRWCGTGTSAEGYEDLGMFDSADRCCRDHDHCRHNIPAFTLRYGVFNSNFYTVSHCACDQRFQKCLLGVNDSIASMVGYGFFNILKVPCFELQQQKRCNSLSWLGMCKEVQDVPHAVFRSNEPFNATGEDEKVPDQSVTEGPHFSTQSPICSPKQTLRGDDYQRRCGGETTQTSAELPTKATEATTEVTVTTKRNRPTPSNDRLRTSSSPRPTPRNTPKPQTTDGPGTWTGHSSSPRGPTPRTTRIPTTHTTKMQERGAQPNGTQSVTRRTDNHVQNMTDIQRRCQILRHLDECRYRIHPLEERFHLQNSESKTVYHCACTRRLAAEMGRLKQPSVLPSLLKEFVSPHCFKLAKKKRCHKRSSCAGGFVKAYDLLHALKKTEAEEEAAAGSSRKRRQRGIPVRLSKRCFRLERENARMARLL